MHIVEGAGAVVVPAERRELDTSESISGAIIPPPEVEVVSQSLSVRGDAFERSETIQLTVKSGERSTPTGVPAF